MHERDEVDGRDLLRPEYSVLLGLGLGLVA